jgi:phosphatidylserine/phosphatidylglycerophosphate/cardiolipin synthase-like enzyme
MFIDDQFGPKSPANTPYPSLTIEGTRLEVYFSPDDGVADQLAALIRTAQKNIMFMAFSFTSDEIADAMLERSGAGVTVSGIFEESQVESNQGDEYSRMRRAGLDVHLDGNTRNMHHKVIIIDGKIVITGSYNYSANAEQSNDENVLVIHNPEVAALYLEEFNRVMSQTDK